VTNRKPKELLPVALFLRRVTLTLTAAAVILGIALAIGVVGYHVIADLPWIDAVLNATMILTGMGPVAVMQTPSAKLFASAYALFSGVVFLSSIAVVLSPVFHRILHKFHIDDSEYDERADR
jgi:hypothetical protein